jgi:hypothetical protein
LGNEAGYSTGERFGQRPYGVGDKAEQKRFSSGDRPWRQEPYSIPESEGLTPLIGRQVHHASSPDGDSISWRPHPVPGPGGLGIPSLERGREQGRA